MRKTRDQQDPESSRAWQLTRARALIEPQGGEIVIQYFDAGQSRSVPWQRRPQASALLAALRDPRRGFDAVVIGEPQRAFYGNQFGLIFPLFEHYGVPLWVPEVGGPIDPNNEAHDLIMSVFGGMSKGERNRIKVRVRAAMAAQARTEGRFLGGRPPTATASPTPARTPTRPRPPTARANGTKRTWRRHGGSSPAATPSSTATGPRSKPAPTPPSSPAGPAAANAERAAAQARLRATTGRQRMTAQEIKDMVTALGDIVAVLAEADPADKAEIGGLGGLGDVLAVPSRQKPTPMPG